MHPAPAADTARLFSLRLSTPINEIAAACSADPDPMIHALFPDATEIEVKTAAFAGCAVACRAPLQQIVVSATLLSSVNPNLAYPIANLASHLSDLLDDWALEDEPDYADMSAFCSGAADLIDLITAASTRA